MQIIFKNKYVYTNIHMQIVTISDKKNHEFKVGCGGIYKRVWREERMEELL